MTSIIKKAQKGNKEAFVALYNANKQRVLYLCNILLCDSDAAESACVHTFKSAWQALIDERIESEREFTDFVINKAVNHCKNKIAKADAKAFKIPQNKNFTVASFAIDSDVDEEASGIALKALPAMQRFIYVLDAYLVWSYDEIAELLHTKEETVKLAIESRKNNLERFSNALKQEKGASVSLSENDFNDFLSDGESECKVYESVDSAVISSIELVIKPIVKIKKKKQLKVGLIVGIPLMLAILLTIGIVAICLSKNDGSEDDGYEDEYYDEYSDLGWISEIENPTDYAIIDVANYGKITVALDANSAPETVENFVKLAKEGFYDGLTFHRIISGFMMQGGDPNGDGTGGYTDESGNEVNVVGEFYYNGFTNLLSHARGAISMARAEAYDSASSQFFIMHDDYYSYELDGYYAVFGYVINGMAVVDAICEDAEPMDDNGTIELVAQPVITSVKIYTPEEYEELQKAESSDAEDENSDATTEEVTVIEAKVAEVSAISARDGGLFLTVYGLLEEFADYQITDAAKVELSSYAASDKLEKYSIDAEAKVYEVNDGALVEFDSASIVEGDMIVVYTDAEKVVNVVVYHVEEADNESGTESDAESDGTEGSVENNDENNAENSGEQSE